jgi:Ca2+:H+ antiporter
MVAAHARTPLWSVLAPLAGLGAYLAVGGMGGALVGVALTTALLVSVIAAVHHAEVVAARVGEPFGAIILALAVTIIEVGLIVSIMLGDNPAPTLVRDTVHAVVVIVMHGIAGLCIVVGTLKHREQEFRVQGAAAFLIVLLPMTAVTLVLPNYTTSTPGPYYSLPQLAFVSVVCLALYVAFTFVQTLRHRDYFTSVLPEAGGERPSGRLAAIALGLLILALTGVVLLAKAFSPFIQAAADAVGAPEAAVGVIVAAIVLMPEAATAVAAARANRLQTSINLALGSGVASIGLTIPVVAAVSWWTATPLTLGVTPGGAVLLALSFMMALVTYGTGRTNLLSGIVHLILFATWLFLIFLP